MKKIFTVIIALITRLIIIPIGFIGIPIEMMIKGKKGILRELRVFTQLILFFETLSINASKRSKQALES